MFRRTSFFRQVGSELLGPASATAAALPLLDAKAHRSFRLERVAACVQESDVILAIQDSNRAFSFIGFPGTPRDDVAQRLAGVPLSAHYFHSVCGREGSACDFYADVDLDPTDDGEAILRTIVDHVQHTLRGGGGSQKSGGAPPVVSILSGSTPRKQSYHVHVRSPVCAFQDFGVVRRVAETINKTLAHDAIDLACYRESGMLRCAFSRKAVTPASDTAPMMPYTPKDPQLASDTAAAASLTKPQLLSLSLVTRQPQPSMRIIRTVAECGGPLSEPRRREGGGAATHSSYLRESTKWVRYSQAVRGLEQLPQATSEHYAQWVRVGLALHSFDGGTRTFRDWVQFSAQSMSNFSEEACTKKWQEFQRRPDCHTWRRGFNYLQHTVWRECGLAAPKRRYTPRK